MRKIMWIKSVSFAMALFVLMSLSVDASAQIFGGSSDRNNRNNSRNTNISDSKVSLGLKEALSQGVRFAVDNLGREDGFYDNAEVRIPMPKSLQSVARVARLAGYADRVDDFELSLNRAAEKAVPVAIDVFVDSIKQMTFTDAKNILFSGQDDAATQFFRRTTEDRLRGKFRPIVQDFTEEVGVTQSYKRMMDKAGFMARFLGNDANDLDGYITEKALDGVFYMVAQEEKKIRKDPIGRTTRILRDVFGILR